MTLATTNDWEHFEDEGAVFQSAPMLRGTMGIESPAVVQRDGLWHLFFTYGPGLWHSVSPTPRTFVASRASAWDVGTGFYYMGPFHATEVLEDRGKWYLTTDRKEETRRLNRAQGRLCYRGSYEDEKTLGKGKKSVAYTITYRDPKSTLTDEKVNRLHEKVRRHLAESLGVDLR